MCELAPRRPSARLPLRGPLARTHSARARVAAAACDNQVSAAPSLRAQDQAIDEVVPDADGAGGGGGLMGLLQGFGHVDFFGLGADQGKGGKAGLESVAEADAAPADNASAVGRGGGGGSWGAPWGGMGIFGVGTDGRGGSFSGPWDVGGASEGAHDTVSFLSVSVLVLALLPLACPPMGRSQCSPRIT